MLDRAIKYAKLYKNGSGMKVSEIAEKIDENEVTVYKLIRMGNAPQVVIAMIRKGLIPATTVSNLLKSSMTDKEMIDVVNEEVQKRKDALEQLHKEGFQGGTSMTAKRAIKLALSNLKKRHLIKGEGQKAIARCLAEIFRDDRKPSVADIESAILMN